MAALERGLAPPSRILPAALAALAALIALAGCGSSGSSAVRTPSASSPAPSTSIATPTSSATLSTPAGSSGPRHPTLQVNPSTGLHDKQVVLLTAAGFSPNEALQAVQCAQKGTATGPGDCNLAGMISVISDAQGRVMAQLPVLAGPFGANRIVCSATTACLISMTQATLAPTEEADAPISFAPHE